MPTDWELPDEWRDATKAEFGITDLDCAFVAQDFKKWWLGPEAKDPEKKDWRATWWRWVRKEAARGIRVPAKWSGRAAFSAEPPSQVSPQHRADERFDDKAPKIFAAGPVWVSGLLANSILRKAPGATKDDLMDVLLSGRFGMDTTEGYLDRYCVERLRAVLAIRRTGVSLDELAGGEPVTVGGVKFKDAFVQLSQRFMDRLTERYPRAFGYEAHHAACSAWYQTKSLATAENLGAGSQLLVEEAFEKYIAAENERLLKQDRNEEEHRAKNLAKVAEEKARREAAAAAEAAKSETYEQRMKRGAEALAACMGKSALKTKIATPETAAA